MIFSILTQINKFQCWFIHQSSLIWLAKLALEEDTTIRTRKTLVSMDDREFLLRSIGFHPVHLSYWHTVLGFKSSTQYALILSPSST